MNVNVKLAIDLRRVNSNGMYSIVLILKNKNVIRVSTPYKSVPENWQDGQYNKKEINYQRKNNHLKDIIQKAERLIIEVSENNRVVSDAYLRDKLKEIVKGKMPIDNVFVDYIDEFAKTKLNARTVDIYIQTKNKIQKFDSDCKFEDIDRAWLTKFERWMIDSGMKTNACSVHMRNIRAVFNYCIDEEYTTLYPFRKFKIKKEETRKRSLTVEQLRTLRDYPCEEYQVRYRDIFMLMFYMIGINAIDLFHAKESDVVDGRLEYKRSKTGKLYSVLIQPEAQAIIDKYKGKSYLLNVLDDYKNYKDFLHRMGDALKDIGPMERKGLGGKKIRQPLFPDISSYWARHTWATIAASLDIPKEVISAGLGHEIGSSITSIYIDFNMKKVDDANRAVIDYVNKE